jgi:hypothetical protein
MIVRRTMSGVLATCALAVAVSGCSGSGGNTAAPGVAVQPDSIHRSALGSTQSQATSGPTTVALTETPRSSYSFVDSVGIVTHFSYSNTPYVTQFPTVANLLEQVKIRHIRDAAIDATAFKPFYGELTQLGAYGIHVEGVSQMNEDLSHVSEFVTSLPGIVEAVEAPNEWNLSGDPNWVADIQASTKALYTAMKSSPSTAFVPVIGPSLTSYQAYQAVGDLSQYSDFGNMHNYFGTDYPGNPGGTPFPCGKYGSIPFFIGETAMVSGTHPVMTTETGYDEPPTASAPVTPAVKVKYSMRTVLDQFNANVARTMFYELVDEGNQNFGFVDANLNPKPVYTGFKNLLNKLDDSPNAFALTPLSYSLTADSTVRHTLLEKSDHSYRLMLWMETKDTAPTQQSQTITIKSATKFSSVAQYAYNDDGTFTTVPLVQAADGSITLTISDRVTELKLQP